MMSIMGVVRQTLLSIGFVERSVNMHLSMFRKKKLFWGYHSMAEYGKTVEDLVVGESV